MFTLAFLAIYINAYSKYTPWKFIFYVIDFLAFNVILTL